jgi:hypothetical protein
MQDIEVLLPNLLSRELFEKALLKSPDSAYLNNLKGDLNSFGCEYDCQCLICGMDQNGRPYLYAINPPGAVTDWTNTGHYAIGTGSQIAFARLLSVDFKITNGLTHTLYDCFDAKVHAEVRSTVGIEWDGCIIYGREGIKDLKDDIKPLLDKVWAQRNRSPFKMKKEPDDMPDPPSRWRFRLRKLMAETLGHAFDETGEFQEF